MHQSSIAPKIGHSFDLVCFLHDEGIDAKGRCRVIGGIANETQFGHFAIGSFLGHCKEIDEIERARWRSDEDGFFELGDEFVEDKCGVAQ